MHCRQPDANRNSGGQGVCRIWQEMRPAQYIKLGGLLEQNRKNGSKNLRDVLKLEMADAFELRKHQARRLGEGAGDKAFGASLHASERGDDNDCGSGIDGTVGRRMVI